MSKRAHPDTDYSSDGGNTPFYLNSTIPIPPPSAAATTMESFTKDNSPNSSSDMNDWGKRIKQDSSTLKETLDEAVVPLLNSLTEQSTRNFHSVQSRISILASQIRDIRDHEEGSRRALENVDKIVNKLADSSGLGSDGRNYNDKNGVVNISENIGNVNYTDFEKRLQNIESIVNTERKQSQSTRTFPLGYSDRLDTPFAACSTTTGKSKGANIINGQINTIELKEQISLMQMKIKKLEDQLNQFVSRVESRPQPAESDKSNVINLSQN